MLRFKIKKSLDASRLDISRMQQSEIFGFSPCDFEDINALENGSFFLLLASFSFFKLIKMSLIALLTCKTG